jgi:hypothetical protein
MRKISLIAAASMLAFGSVNAAEQPASIQKGEKEPVAADAGPAASDGEPANRHVILNSGSMRPSPVAGTAVSQSGMRAPAFVPMTPFVSYAMSGNAVNDEELQEQIEEVREREQRMLQHPEYRDLLRARQRLALSYSHPDLPELLQISEEQADQLLDLLAEQQVREQAASTPTWPRHGDAAAMQAFVERTQERQRANEAELAALLGASKFQEWKEYEQSGMARILVQQLQQMLPDDARLRSDQLRPLVSAIAREQRQLFEDRALSLAPGQVPDEDWQKRVQERQLERMAAANQRILDASASILTPRQLERFGSLLQQQLDGHSQRTFFFGRMAPLSPPSSPSDR